MDWLRRRFSKSQYDVLDTEMDEFSIKELFCDNCTNGQYDSVVAIINSANLMVAQKIINYFVVTKYFWIVRGFGHAYTADQVDICQLLLKKYNNAHQEINYTKIFPTACANGCAKTVGWTLATFRNLLAPNTIQKGFSLACQNGHLDIVLMLIFQIDSGHNYDEEFTRACSRGHLEIAQLLLQSIPTINPANNNNRPIKLACGNNHRSVVDWLITLTDVDIRICNDWIFAICAERNHVEMMKWLIKLYPTIDGAARKEYAFRWICRHGDLEMVKWYLHHYPDTNIHIDEESVLRICCKHGHLPVIEWLVDNYPIDTRVKNDHPFKIACQYGHLNVVKWFHQHEPAIDFTYENNMVLYYASHNNHLALFEWYHQTYPTVDVTEFFSYAFSEGSIDILNWYWQHHPHIELNRFYKLALKMVPRVKTLKWIAEHYSTLCSDTKFTNILWNSYDWTKYDSQYISTLIELFIQPLKKNMNVIFKLLCKHNDLLSVQLFTRMNPPVNYFSGVQKTTSLEIVDYLYLQGLLKL